MKVVFSIARNEVRYLFYSPIAWFVLIIFLVQCGYFYAEPLYGLANTQDIQMNNNPSYTGFKDSLTKIIFLESEFFLSIIKNLYLFIPILTMGLISRESTSGTNALLYSSPVSICRIVLGKYLGILFYNLLLVLVIALFLVAGMFTIKEADYGALLSALLGFYLLVCTYSAIGLFMSSLSNYQIISALSTFIAIFILSIVGSLWQRYDVLRDLTWFLSLQNRTANMLKGLIVTKDVIYFVLVSFMFVAFTYFRLVGMLEFRPWFVRTGRYVATVAAILLIGYFCSRPAVTGYLDATYTQRNTLNPVTQQLLKEFGDSTLEVTLYTNLLGKGMQKGLPEARNGDYMAEFWEPYLRFKPDIKFNYVYYYGNDPTQDDSTFFKRYRGKTLDEVAQEQMKMVDADPGMFQSEAEMEPVANLRAESKRGVVMQLKYQGRTAFLRTFNDRVFWPSQFHATAALHRVLGTAMPKIAFSSGSLERSIYQEAERDYSYPTTLKLSRLSLLNMGYDVDTINLYTQAIPATISALVIADPRMEFTSEVQEKINRYVHEGGNLMVLGEPGKQHIVNPLLSQFGVQLSDGQLVYPSVDETPDKVKSNATENGITLLDELLLWRKDSAYQFMIDTSKAILMQGATAVNSTGIVGWKSEPLAATVPDKAWLKMGAVVIDSTLPPFNPQAGDIEQVSFTTIQSLTRLINGKKQQVIVSGDADFANNLRYANQATFVMAIYKSITESRFPIIPSSVYPKDLLFTIGERGAHYQKILFIWIMPAIVLLTGTVLLVRRKRK